MNRPPPSRAHLATEASNPASERLDSIPPEPLIALVQSEDSKIHVPLARARREIADAIELVTERLQRGGRLIYVGAGTSGRLGMLDAVECGPTFQCPPEQVQAVLAGGPAAMTGAVEGAEDDGDAARAELERRELCADDVVFGISAGGTTPFVHAAIDCAREVGAGTVFFACVSQEAVPDRADVSIRVDVGPEVLTGSTRLKAGTATKLTLNLVSTITMSRLGKVHGNLMVDLNTRGNAKLVDRGARIVAQLTGLERDVSLELLERAEGHVKTAVVMQQLELDLAAARARLEECGGFLRKALERE